MAIKYFGRSPEGEVMTREERNAQILDDCLYGEWDDAHLPHPDPAWKGKSRGEVALLKTKDLLMWLNMARAARSGNVKAQRFLADYYKKAAKDEPGNAATFMQLIFAWARQEEEGE